MCTLMYSVYILHSRASLKLHESHFKPFSAFLIVNISHTAITACINLPPGNTTLGILPSEQHWAGFCRVITDATHRLPCTGHYCKASCDNARALMTRLAAAAAAAGRRPAPWCDPRAASPYQPATFGRRGRWSGVSGERRW